MLIPGRRPGELAASYLGQAAGREGDVAHLLYLFMLPDDFTFHKVIMGADAEEETSFDRKPPTGNIGSGPQVL
jgi:hypothetical protein